MTVYVDDMHRYPAGQFGRMKMSHMLADTDDELHVMASLIGVARKWHQAPPKASSSHYDIALSKRARAVELGAVEITWKQAGCMAALLRLGCEMGDPTTAQDRYLAEIERRKPLRIAAP